MIVPITSTFPSLTGIDQPELETLKAEDLTESQEVAAELAERLSLMIKYNHRGSLTSLDREQVGIVFEYTQVN